MPGGEGERPAAPVLIGISGKRDLRGAEAAVRVAIDTMFDLIDARLPNSPRILLSALAAGADTVAAEAALARGWRVVAPLPFRQAVYEQDFADAPEDLARLRGLIAHPDVTVLSLAPLNRPGVPKPLEEAMLTRFNGANAERTLHYEQVGLFIAERSALMVGVVGPDELPDRVGGAARILAFRLSGADPIARETRARSVELLPENPLEEPRTAPVWRVLLEPERVEPLRLTVQITAKTAQTPLEAGPDLDASLAVPEWTDRLNSRLPPVAANAASSGWGARLDRLRRGVSLTQARLKDRVKAAVTAIATLFFFAVVCLEGHIALKAAYGWAACLSVFYAGFAVLAVGVYLLASAREWQPQAEDYRAVSEALRMQIVLWRAGLTSPRDRVDLRYLRNARGSAARLRQAIGQIIEAVRLTGPPAAQDLKAVESWIRGQGVYFDGAIAKREKSVGFAQNFSWFLFTAALGLAGSLLLVQSGGMEGLFEWPKGAIMRGGLLTVLFLLLFPLFALVGHFRRQAGRAPYQRWRRRVYRLAWVTPAMLAGLAVAAALCLLVSILPKPDLQARPEPEHQVAELVIMAAVVATTLAGVIRYRAEKLSWEAELQGFEQTHGYFGRALARFEALRDADDPEGAREVVRDLVDEALRENEAWLVSHRERPLEPVIGG